MTREQMEKMEAFRKQMGHGPSPLVPPDAGGRLLVRQDPGFMLRDPEKWKRAGKAGKAPARKPLPEAERTKPNKTENQFMMDLMVLRNTLARRAPEVRERLEKVNSHAWRDLRLLQSLVWRLQDQLIETMPKSREDYYREMSRHANYAMTYTGRPIRQEHTVLISDRSLGAILDVCMENECLMCLRDGKEIEECPIRQALLEVGPPSRIREDGSGLGCEYRNVPGQLINGKEITI